jgi:hypothetical protein
MQTLHCNWLDAPPPTTGINSAFRYLVTPVSFLGCGNFRRLGLALGTMSAIGVPRRQIVIVSPFSAA